MQTRDIFRDVFRHHADQIATPTDYVNHSLYFEARTFLHGLLVVEDKLSMAHGLESRVPFIFMNAVGVHRDVSTLIHEAGHAFHSYLARDRAGFEVHAPMEFCEVASMSMEYMTMKFWDDAFGQETANQMRRGKVVELMGTLSYIAMVDHFQHWIYTDPKGKVASERHKKWTESSGCI